MFSSSSTSSSSANEENTQFANFIAQVQPKGQVILVDMHGSGVNQAKATVQHYIKLAPVMGYETIRFVTGRGNHVHANGESGILYKSFNEWLTEIDTSSINVETFDGYYEVEFKNTASQTNFITPLDAFFNKNLETYLKENFPLVKAKAEAPDADRADKIALALCYEKGIGVKQNYKKSTDIYLELAKDPEDAIANYEAGSRYFIGKGVKQDDTKAMYHLIRSADKNYVLAQLTVGNIFWKGLGTIKQDYKLGNKYLHMAAKNGNAEATRKIGHSFYHGWGVELDYAKAIQCWKVAVKRKDAVSAFNLASAYINCPGITPDPAKVIEYTNIAAELGDPDAQCNLGAAYFFGFKGFTKDIPKAIYWLELAAGNLSKKAAFLLFSIYKGQNNLPQALKYLWQAAESNEINAQILILTASPEFLNKKFSTTQFNEIFQNTVLAALLKQSDDKICEVVTDDTKFNLIDLLLCEDSSKAEIKKAMGFLRKLISENNAIAAFQLGLLYIRGLSDKLKPNPQEAQKNWLIGAKLDNTDCLCGLGYHFEKTNPKKSLENFHRAAELGDPHAHHQLAYYHYFGKNGLTVNISLAVEHYKKAINLAQANENMSAKDNATLMECCHALGCLYLEEYPGFSRDTKQGLYHLEIAAQNHYVPSIHILIQHHSEHENLQEAFLYGVMGEQIDDQRSKAFMQKMWEMQPLRAMITSIRKELNKEKKNPTSQYGRLFQHATVAATSGKPENKTAPTSLRISGKRA
jgi:TPR repeat protein